ncbi:MAG: NRDE family protein [Zoogloeaceae bacterium]|jgi:uncharacterized protein with NRDE domain|nr:NRDE family protein [Zoogloeaceae bacterium]
MCLIVFAWQVRADTPLILAANRDEFYSRPTLPLAPWEDQPEILGGRDLEAGGGWLAVHRDGRFAALTNVREATMPAFSTSRGVLLARYLQSGQPPAPFLASLDLKTCAGCNLLLGDCQTLLYASNRNGVRPRLLDPGIYGLSNAQLDTPWPKLTRAKAAFAAALKHWPDPEPFFDFLRDRRLAADADLPQTGVSLALERKLSPIFIASPDYGSRASTLFCRHADGSVQITERRFGANGIFLGETTSPDKEIKEIDKVRQAW